MAGFTDSLGNSDEDGVGNGDASPRPSAAAAEDDTRARSKVRRDGATTVATGTTDTAVLPVLVVVGTADAGRDTDKQLPTVKIGATNAIQPVNRNWSRTRSLYSMYDLEPPPHSLCFCMSVCLSFFS